MCKGNSRSWSPNLCLWSKYNWRQILSSLPKFFLTKWEREKKNIHIPRLRVRRFPSYVPIFLSLWFLLPPHTRSSYSLCDRVNSCMVNCFGTFVPQNQSRRNSTLYVKGWKATTPFGSPTQIHDLTNLSLSSILSLSHLDIIFFQCSMLGRQVRTNAWVCSDWGLGEGERGPFGRVWSQVWSCGTLCSPLSMYNPWCSVPPCSSSCTCG